MWLDIQDLITCALCNFGDDWLSGLGVARGRISRFPIDLHHRHYNTLALTCECVIGIQNMSGQVKNNLIDS